VLLTWRYIVWRFAASLPPLALRPESLYAWTFATVEALAAIGWTLNFITLMRTGSRSAEASANRGWLDGLRRPPRVDVLITTYNEDQSILTRTITAALVIDFPDLRVWVLDDGRRPWLERYCEEEGALYLTRSDNHGAKAGNINHALGFLRDYPDVPEFIAVLDADFVPHPDILWRTVPLFRDPKVGVVQTPQHFFNKDPIQSNLLVGDVWPDEQRFFFDHVMPSKDAWGAAFCCGTSSVIRFRALEDIGGFPIDSVTEDFLVTLELDRKGWRTLYLNKRLSVGLAPEGMREYVTQRGRWCLGLMQIVRSRLGPFCRGRLSIAYRIGLVDAFLYWAASFPFKLLCLAAPIVCWFTGLFVINAPAGETVAYFLPYYAAVTISLSWATGGMIQPILTDVGHVLTMPAALKATAVGLFRSSGHSFKVTAKGGRRDRFTIQWPMIFLFGGLGILTLSGMVYGSFSDYAPLANNQGAKAITVFWSAYNIIVLLVAMSVCIELPRYRRQERFITSERVRIRVGDRTLSAVLVDISTTGARIMGPRPAAPNTIIWVTIDQVGEIPAHVVDRRDAAFAVEFVGADSARKALIRKLFSGHYGQPPRQVRRAALSRALLARALR
jgi:cellulose synthase (UDP-forming)